MVNIALVVLDTLRKDAFDRHFDWLPGRRFERAYSTANWTVPAHASLFTGKYASEVGIHAKNMYFDCPEPTLAEQLHRAGYTTRAFSANTNVTGHFDFDRGFSDFRTPGHFPSPCGAGVFNWQEFTRTSDETGIRKYFKGLYECFTRDVDTVSSLIAGVMLKLNEQTGVKYGGAREALKEIHTIDFGDREFLFLNLMDAHEPYIAPNEYMTVDGPSLVEAVGDIPLSSIDREQLPCAYDNCIKYLSDVYRDIFSTLTADFDYVITLSDHGEMLGERNMWGHEHGIYPELTHVPLCVSGTEMDDTSTETVSLIDIHETVLSMAGIDAASDGRGQSLLGCITERERLTEFLGLTSWSERNLKNNGYSDHVDRYDETLRGYVSAQGYYEYETLDGFSETETRSVDSFQDGLHQLVDELDVRRVEKRNEVPDEIKDQLEHLGYG